MAAPLKSPDIYAYTDYRKYLKDCYETSRFSYRSFAQMAGYNSSGLYPNIVNGLRNLTSHFIPAFAKALRLTARETEFFALLAEFGNSNSDVARQHIFSQMTTYLPDRVQRLHSRHREFYSNWYHVAIHQALGAVEVRDDVTELAEFLRPKIGIREAQRSLKVLEELGLISRNEHGFWKPSHTNISSGKEVGELFIRGFQATMLDLGKEVHDIHSILKRYQVTETVGVSAAMAEKIRARVREFHHEIVQMVLNDKAREQTVLQLNLQLFPVSETK